MQDTQQEKEVGAQATETHATIEPKKEGAPKPLPIMEGSRVQWVSTELRGGKPVRGSGQVITNPLDGHVLVAVDMPDGQPKPVIYCATTWLEVLA